MTEQKYMPSQQAVVDLCEKLLSQAKAGDLIGLVAVSELGHGAGQDRSNTWENAGFMELFAMIGCLDSAQRGLHRMIEAQQKPDPVA